jgi:hypothetical protein
MGPRKTALLPSDSECVELLLVKRAGTPSVQFVQAMFDVGRPM